MAWWNVLAALDRLRHPAPKPDAARTLGLLRGAGLLPPADYAEHYKLADAPTGAASHSEFGVSGTETFGGDVVIDEYNPILRWPNAVLVYDEMRRSSPDVIAALRVLKLPILRATFDIRPPAKGDTQDRAIADFCTWVLLRNGAMREPWQRVLRHLLLMLDFGFSAVELVWNVSVFDGRPVYNFWRLAPRLPKTLQGWKVNPYGELAEMVQYAPKNGVWAERTIPADYLCVNVHEREGDNFNGTSVLRGAYKPWYYTNQLEHIDMIRHHRFSAGLPEAKATENTKLTATEKKITENTLATIASSESSFIITPSKLDFKLHFPPSGESGVLKSIEYHTFSIARSILAGFLNNQAEGLNTNRTRTLASMFSDLLEAQANEMAADLSRQIIVRICDQNFDMTGREYPEGVFTNVNPIDMAEVSDIFAKIGPPGFVTPDDDLEVWLRNVMGAPEMQAGVERVRGPQQPAVPGTGAEGDVAPGQQPADDNTSDEQRIAAREAAVLRAADRILTAHSVGARTISSRDGSILIEARRIQRARATAPERETYAEPVEWQGRMYGRQPTELERTVLALAEIPDRLDTTVEAFTADMIAMRKAQLKRAAEWLASRDSLSGVTPDLIPMQDAGDAYSVTREMQLGMDVFGAQQVRHELMRQGAPATLFARDEPGDELYATRKKELSDALVASARSFADWMITEWRSDILDAAVRLRRTGVEGDALEKELLRELDQRAEQGVLRFTKQKVNEAYEIGRHREAEKHSDVIARVVQSALLDRNTCKPCTAVDGEEMRYGSARQRQLSPPYRNCFGKENCRCTQLYIYENAKDRAREGVRLRDRPTPAARVN